MGFQASRRQLYVAETLLAMRTTAGLSLQAVAQVTGISASKISRIENAANKASSKDVRALAKHYGADSALIEKLCEAARDSVTDTWWTRYDRFLTASYVNFLVTENEARTAWSLQPMFVPGMLQARPYIEAILSTGPTLDPDRADAEVEVRLHRQTRLTEPEPLVYHAIIGQPVLHWEFGGPDILRAQLRHFREIADLPNVCIQVIPFERPTTVYSIDLFEFEPGDPPVCFDETQWGTPLHDDPLEVRQAQRRLAHAQTVALSEVESKQFIEQRMREAESK
ncbi:helix-turn-helix domain-containing protein [Actinospica durhamensis]|uniref:Helix-turn-helix domain-containing protein n=1 Tax=Actinospica durhamensis TaxID=1508375 RepID=A0A941EXH1_9ACTN|nr:helix-turn-helix transcriptional regulator [Actinospica durhamensis]MBR7839665.1 helix-turn-helix domain-containing protein [Actinospica durhamensis]